MESALVPDTPSISTRLSRYELGYTFGTGVAARAPTRNHNKGQARPA